MILLELRYQFRFRNQ